VGRGEGTFEFWNENWDEINSSFQSIEFSGFLFDAALMASVPSNPINRTQRPRLIKLVGANTI